jgi:hypothetical protein
MNDIHLDRALSEEFAGKATKYMSSRQRTPRSRLSSSSTMSYGPRYKGSRRASPPADDDVLEDLEKSLHVHVVLGLSDGTTRGGHVVSGTVRPHELGCGARR